MILAIDTSQMTYTLATEDWSSAWDDVNTTILDQLQGIPTEKIEIILVNIGPGRFSGLRSGIAFAKGFARAKDLPIVPINRFELIKESISEDSFHIALDARKDQAYLQSSNSSDIQLVSQSYLQDLKSLYGNIAPANIINTDAKSMIDYYLKHKPLAKDISSIEPLYIRDSV